MSAFLAWLLACTPPIPETAPDAIEPTDPTETAGPTGPVAPTWEVVDASAVAPLWGAMSVGSLSVAGVDTRLDAVADVLDIRVSDGVLEADVVGELQAARFCGCAMEDAARGELIALGGRGADYNDADSAERIDLATGTSTALDHGGAADHPVGCWAAFSDEHDRGYVFGGAGGMMLSDETWRYDPATDVFELLDIAGPTPRYDAAAVPLPDGGLLLVGGMDESMSFARTDLWRLDPATETWAELPVTSEAEPPGRRLPFAALTPDGTRVIVGYGSDHPSGMTVRKDLWAYELETGAWEKLQFDGEKPAARGFVSMWPGPEDSVAVMAFGVDGSLTSFEDAWVLRVP